MVECSNFWKYLNFLDIVFLERFSFIITFLIKLDQPKYIDNFIKSEVS